MRHFTLAVVIALAACGGSTKKPDTVATKHGKEKRDPVKPAAYKEFEAAMRAIRLGGPEASETARARLRSALKIDNTIWEAWFDLGAIAWREGDDDEAIEDYGHALDLNKGHTPSLMARAEAYRREGKKKEARADYEAAAKNMDEDDPNKRDVAARLASLLRDAGEYDDAVEVLRDTVRTNGINAKIYTELGQIYLAQKRLELAQLVLAKAVQMDAKDPAIYNALAILAARQGKPQESFQLFDQAASLDPNYIDARFNKAAVLLDAGDYARAKSELAAIVEKRPDDYAAVVSLGVAQRGLKAFDEAKKDLDRVIKEAPKKSSARADAMWNIATLKLDFTEDAAGGKAESGAISARSSSEPRETARRREQVQGGKMQVRAPNLNWGLIPTLVLAMCAFVAPASAQPHKKAPKAEPAQVPDKKAEGDAPTPSGKTKDKDKVKNFDFNALDLNGRMRTPQLLYFLERANEELERASLEKRSFIPHMVKSVEEESL